MNLKELDSFKISDAITFHDKLNPKLWNNNNLRPEVKKQLLIIAQDFLSELGVNDLDVKDLTISGSNAAFSYTPHSDLDLHILVDMSKLDNNEIYKELFNAKKNIYNDTHTISIHGVPVELYVQDAREPVVSLGEYSIKDDKWLRIPTKRRANFDQTATKAKYEKLLDLVQYALASGRLSKIQTVIKKIKQYRQAGLDKGGEFGPENLAYKALRSQGLITKLYDLRDKLHSDVLTIETMYQDPAKIQRDALEEKLSKEFEDYDPNGIPPGPEFKPTMPAGTVKVDVSDVYDWYKLGQHISNLDGLGHHDFGQGPPSTIMAFGSEDEEHKYIDALKKTGLTTTDIDPFDPNQPKGMKRQKVDPTYNVNEAFDQPYKLKWEAGDYGDVDAIAKLDDGNYLSIMFNKGYNQDKEEAWNVEFYRNNSQEVTGEGDAQRVFATVLSAIQTFIKKYKPNRVIFSASKDNWTKQQQNSESRASLYDRLIQRYSKAWGFRAFRADTGDKVIYELNRIKPVKEDTETTTEHYNGIEISLEVDNDEVMVTAMMTNGREMGHVLFVQEGDYLMPQDLEVEERYQGQGIAATMYDYVKSKGYKIRRSGQQTDAGAGFWDKHRPEKNVWEDDTMQYAAEKTSAINPYGGLRDNQYRGDISEVRSNPEQNPKPESGMKELASIAKTINDPENWAISMTSEPKLGINPQVGISEDTPKGIYFYPLNYALSKTRYGKLPWGDNYPYIQLFQYDRSGEMTKETKIDPVKLKQALSQYCSEEVIQQAIDDPEYDGTPYWFIYDCLSRLGKSDETNVVRWNKVLRDLGFTSVYDDGDGWIAYNEPTQGVVLDPRIIKQHKTIVNKKQSGVVTPAVIERAIFETMDMELAANRAWQAYDPDGSKLRAAAKEYAKKPEFNQYYGKPGTEEIFNKAEGMGRYGARQLSHIAFEWFKEQQAQSTVNEASGYIPSEKEKNDPRFKTALTVDIKPDSIKKNAKAFYWNTSRAGIPPTLKANGK